jgi:hypothetical protein
MGDIKSYRDLVAWQEAMDLAVSVYTLTRAWPKEELYGLTSQARRAAVSVAANIAEGYGRENLGSYVHFLRIAQRVGIAADDVVTAGLGQADKVGRVLRGLIRKLEAEA